MQKCLVNTAHMDATTVSGVMTGVLIVCMLLQPVFGALSGRIGCRKNMILFGGFAMVCTVPLFNALAQVSSAYTALALVLGALVIASFYTSISGVVKAELFRAEVRALGVGFTNAVGNALFGGTAKNVALPLKSANHEGWFPWYVSILVALALAASLWMPDSRRYSFLDGTTRVDM